ncbi:MAG TPA: hypothetical protein VK002_04595 [Rubricoccaceae bacterium]|jgi:hypothetical protein|nr:hypothetical protein [Rubricoccaceae bacterium]
MIRVAFLPVLLVLCAAASAQPRAVVVNGERVPEATLGALEAYFGVQVQEGAYWYDPYCGAWGFEGGPTVGLLPVGLPFSPDLRADASRGRTDVYVNGRRLPAEDLRAIEALTGPVLPGRYWLDAYGNAGPEGGPAVVNLVRLARAAGGGSAFYRSDDTGVGAGSSGGTSYVMGPDWSVTVDW